MIFCKNDHQTKIKKLNNSNNKIHMINIRYLKEVRHVHSHTHVLSQLHLLRREKI